MSPVKGNLEKFMPASFRSAERLFTSPTLSLRSKPESGNWRQTVSLDPGSTPGTRGPCRDLRFPGRRGRLPRGPRDAEDHPGMRRLQEPVVRGLGARGLLRRARVSPAPRSAADSALVRVHFNGLDIFVRCRKLVTPAEPDVRRHYRQILWEVCLYRT